MQNHQFGILSTDWKTILKELHTIHFLNQDMEKMEASQLLKDFLFQAFPSQKSNSNKLKQLSNLMATPEEDAKQFLEGNHPITTDVFYNLALQLLHFSVHNEFELSQPLNAMKKMNLPYHSSNNDQLSSEEVIKNWYLLLNTRTKFGQTFLEDLASYGYFTQFSDLPHPLIFNGKAQPVFNTDKLVREVVYVETPLDTDHDQKRDLIKLQITRPSETYNDIKVPTIFTASPYHLGVNEKEGEKRTHQVNVPLERKKPNQTTLEDISGHSDLDDPIPAPRKVSSRTHQTEETFDNNWTYTLNDYFLARGFAVVYSAGIGTKGSEGLRTDGGESETVSTTSVIQWLTGDRIGFTNPYDNIATDAWWSNGNVAMTGRSYLGTLQIAAATTGVKGLKTFIEEAGIASWYDYYRENGLAVAPGGFQGEDADVLAEETFSRRQEAGDFNKIKDKWEKQIEQITKDQDRNSGNYNEYWEERNYLKNASNIKADVVLVHGLNDWNVKPINVEKLWKALDSKNVNKKMFLHQGQHININNLQSLDFNEMMNLWLTKKLLNVDNHAEKVIPDVTIQDNVEPQTWHPYNDWAKNNNYSNYYLADQKLNQNKPTQAKLAFNDQLNQNDFIKYQNSQNEYATWYDDLLTTDKLSNNRLLFKTDKLNHDQYLDGNINLKLRIASSQNVGMLSAMLIDFGSRKRLTVSPQVLAPNAINEGYHFSKDHLKDFQLQNNETLYKKITEGHMNLQNRHNSYKNDELEANQFYDVELKLQPTFYHLPAGQQIGLVLYSTDFAMTNRGNQDITYTIDPANSIIQLPFHK